MLLLISLFIFTANEIIGLTDLLSIHNYSLNA
jgi:hypothetical protein